MIDNLLSILKIGIRSVFTVKKYDSEILDEDLNRILFIRNYIEECSLYVKETNENINEGECSTILKSYALESSFTCSLTVTSTAHNHFCLRPHLEPVAAP